MDVFVVQSRTFFRRERKSFNKVPPRRGGTTSAEKMDAGVTKWALHTRRSAFKTMDTFERKNNQERSIFTKLAML